LSYDEIIIKLNDRQRRKAELLAEVARLDQDIDFLQALALEDIDFLQAAFDDEEDFSGLLQGDL